MGAQAARFVDSGNEWATPWWVVSQAAGVLGIQGFDLDVAATAQNAKAPRFYTKADNGLRMKWYGNVWLNSPFSRSEAVCKPGCTRKTCAKRGVHLDEPIHGSVDFAEVAVQQLQQGNCEAIAWHGPVATDTKPTGGTFPSQTLILRSKLRPTAWVPTYLMDPPKQPAWPECIDNFPEVEI